MNSNLRSMSRSVMGGIKSVESRANALSTDKNVLYIMLIIAFVNVMGYLLMGNFEAVVFFAIIAYLSTFFTKNMVYVFLIAILATNFLMASKVKYFKANAREGMENNNKDVAPAAAAAAPIDAATAAANPAAPTAAPTAVNPAAAQADALQLADAQGAQLAAAAPVAAQAKPMPTKAAAKKSKEGMNGKLTPAKFNTDDMEDDDNTPFPSSKAQAARNVEKAHDNLQNIGGMSAQTDQVMQQQKILMDNMKTMQPFLETAERFLDKFNMKGIDGLLGKVGLGSGQHT